MSVLTILLIIVIAFIAGIEGILDEFQFHQPLISCTLIGLVCNQLELGIMLGGTLQMIALGWANIGAAVAPDVTFAAVAASILLMKSQTGIWGMYVAIAIAIPLSMIGLFLTNRVRTISVDLAHRMDEAIEFADDKEIAKYHFIGIALQGMRVALPACILLLIPSSMVHDAFVGLPQWLDGGLIVGGSMVVVVGYAIVINVLARKNIIAFFLMGFLFAMIDEFSILSLSMIAIVLTFFYLSMKGGKKVSGKEKSEDPLSDILNDY